MHQGDTGSGYYQYYQSQFQNPSPNSNPMDPPPPLQQNPFPPAPAAATFASAPPVASTHSSDYSSYYASNSSAYPPYPQSADQPLNQPPLTYQPNSNAPPSNPSPQPYNFPHLNPPAAPYYGYDQNHASLGYDHMNPSYNSNPNPGISANAYAPASNYGGQFESGSNYGVYGDVGKQRTDVGPGYEYSGGKAEPYGGYQDEGVYQYSGGKVEPYGARGTGTKSSSSSGGAIFDDYGRPIGFGNEKKQNGSGSTGKIVRAVPKAETQQDMGSGVQKYRVKVLSEGAGQTDMDVLCQVGLDGIRLLDTATGRTLRIYPLESVTRCEVLDSYIFAFWAKTSVDMDAKRIRLKSNSYTTNNILDTVTAATFQIKEIGVRNDSSNTLKVSEQQAERKKGLADWVNLMKPRNEEKDHWVPDEAVAKCTSCASDFGAFLRRHHCRNCGDIFCDKCTQGRIALTEEENALPVRVCDRCMAEVTQRLANAKQSVGKVSVLQSHEDLARKLKEEMDKNRKTSSGLTSNGSGMRTKDVACPTCTVHLQVQVPASGSETIECSVCQHPFLVSAH